MPEPVTQQQLQDQTKTQTEGQTQGQPAGTVNDPAAPVLGGDAAPSGTPSATQESGENGGSILTGGEPQGSAGQPGAPESYDLALPEGSLLSADRVGEIAAYAKERNLPNDVAQELLQQQSEAVGGFLAGEQEKLEQAKVQWVNDLKNDKHFGGDNFNRTCENAKRAFDRFAPESFKETLNRTGLGNHPDLIKTFARIGELMSDDALITQQVKMRDNAKRTPEEILYPSTPTP